jgi:hypothetical protein
MVQRLYVLMIVWCLSRVCAVSVCSCGDVVSFCGWFGGLYVLLVVLCLSVLVVVWCLSGVGAVYLSVDGVRHLSTVLVAWPWCLSDIGAVTVCTVLVSVLVMLLYLSVFGAASVCICGSVLSFRGRCGVCQFLWWCGVFFLWLGRLPVLVGCVVSCLRG